MTDEERARLTAAIAGHLGLARMDIQARALALFYRVHEDFGAAVEALLKAAAAGTVRLAAAKEPSTKGPALLDVPIKLGHAIVDIGPHADGIAPGAAIVGSAAAAPPSTSGATAAAAGGATPFTIGKQALAPSFGATVLAAAKGLVADVKGAITSAMGGVGAVHTAGSALAGMAGSSGGSEGGTVDKPIAAVAGAGVGSGTSGDKMGSAAPPMVAAPAAAAVAAGGAGGGKTTTPKHGGSRAPSPVDMFI